MALANLLWKKKNNHTNKQKDLSLAVSSCAGVASACHLRLIFFKELFTLSSCWLLEKRSERAGSWTREETSEGAYWASRWHPHPALTIGHSECTQEWQQLTRYGGRAPSTLTSAETGGFEDTLRFLSSEVFYLSYHIIKPGQPLCVPTLEFFQQRFPAVCMMLGDWRGQGFWRLSFFLDGLGWLIPLDTAPSTLGSGFPRW